MSAPVTRRRLLQSAGVAGAVGLVALGAPNVAAAEEDKGGSIVGAWKGSATFSKLPPFQILTSFADGGSLVSSGSIDLQPAFLSTPGYGAWKRNGSGKYAIKFDFFTFDSKANPAGSGEVKATITVDGDEFHGSVTVQIIDLTGAVVFSDSGTLKATRIEAD